MVTRGAEKIKFTALLHRGRWVPCFLKGPSINTFSINYEFAQKNYIRHYNSDIFICSLWKNQNSNLG